MAPVLEKVECFGDHANASPHFESARSLLKRGVWIGYMDQPRKSFEGLPSFHDLIMRSHRFVTPFPDSTPGKSGNARYAVCYGCCDQNRAEDSHLLKILELPFTDLHKVSILPLLGENKELLFCILKSDPVLRKFTRYSFWETEGEYSTTISLLGTTESVQRHGTLDAIQAAHDNTIQQAEAKEVDAISRKRSVNRTPRKTAREAASTPGSGRPPKRQRTTAANTPIANKSFGHDTNVPASSTLRGEAQELERLVSSIDNGSHGAPLPDVEEEDATNTAANPITPKKKMKSPTKSTPRTTRSSHVEPLETVPDPEELSRHESTPVSSAASVSLPNRREPVTPSISDGSHAHGAAPRDVSNEPPDELSDEVSLEQAQRVRFVWTFDADGREGRIMLCLASCPTAKRFFELLEKEANQEQETKRLFRKAKLWWLDRKELDGTIKGIRMIPTNDIATNELAFRYLREEIAISDHWKSGKGDFTIDLKPRMG